MQFAEMVEKIKDGGKRPFRPLFSGTSVVSGNFGDKLKELMMNCWNEEPLDRPSLFVIEQTVKQVFHGK